MAQKRIAILVLTVVLITNCSCNQERESKWKAGMDEMKIRIPEAQQFFTENYADLETVAFYDDFDSMSITILQADVENANVTMTEDELEAACNLFENGLRRIVYERDTTSVFYLDYFESDVFAMGLCRVVDGTIRDEINNDMNYSQYVDDNWFIWIYLEPSLQK